MTAYEIGYKISTRSYSLNLSAYTYRFKDYQTTVAVPVGNTGTLTSIFRNAANAKLHGIDVDGTWYVTPDLMIAGGFAYQPKANFGTFPNAVVNVPGPAANGAISSPRDRTNGRLTNAPKFSGTLRGEYTTRLAAGDLVFGASIYRTSKFNFDLAAIQIQPSYTTADANVSFQPTGTQLKATIWVKNLTNEAYYRTYFNANFIGFSWAAPRQFGVTLEQRF